MKSNRRALKVPAPQPRLALALAACSLLAALQAGAGWIPLTTTPVATPPNTNFAGHMLLLSDATVMVQNRSLTARWFRLTPDNTGSYINGTWSNLEPMNYPRDNYASVVLRDGRVFVAGGEQPINGPQRTNSEIYNPTTGHWATTAAGGVNFSDSESVLLPDGTVLVHPLLATNVPPTNMIFNATKNSWALGGTNTGKQDEATWVKLPDDSILTINKYSTNSERYIPALNEWIPDADVLVNMWAQSETGAGLLLPDSRAFFLGASGHTALYTPTGTTNQGSWAVGPDIPDGLAACDAPAAMMVNGRILCAVGVAHQSGSQPPIWFYEYDYTGRTISTNGTEVTVNTNGAFHPVAAPGDSTNGLNAGSGSLYLLDLPDGTVLLANNEDPTGQLYVYKPGTSPLTSGKPTVDRVSWNADGSLHLSGTLFNGISQGASFGDDAQQDSNYPIVRFTDGTGLVYYGTTYNWSSTSVMTGDSIVTTEVMLPSNIHDAPGKYSLAVIANGIASDPVTFYGPVWVDFNFTGILQFGTYSFPFMALSNGVPAVASGGTIAFKANVQPSVSPETMTISKPMTLISVGGPATIGQ